MQLSRIVDFEPGPYQATLVNNADWTAADRRMLDFLRDVGKHVTVNQMMAKESVQGPARERARHLVHRVQLHAAAGQRLPAPLRAPRRRDPDRWLRPVGQHRRRRRPDPAQTAGTAVHALDLAAAARAATASKFGKTDGRRGVARPGARPRRTSSASSGCRSATTRSRDYLQMFSTAPARRDRGDARRARAGARASASASGPWPTR